MVAYGNNGLLRWSAEGDVTSWPDANSVIIDNTKIVNAYVSRGSASPQILCWTLNSLYVATYTQVGNENVFSHTPIEGNISILSANSIVQYDNQFFWIGIDRFYFFNGVIQTLKNSMSLDWFFDGVNLSARAKIWGMAIPRYNEIWWHYPKGRNQTECNATIIYNIELQTWYDSVIGRSAGVQASIFPLPMMADSSPFFTLYPLWMHEFGTDQIYGANNLAIESHYETNMMTLFQENPNNNRLIRSRRIEPDFIMKGNMNISVNNRMFPRSQVITTGPYSFNNMTEKIDDIDSQGRLVSYVFSSNEVGGDYQAGNTILDYDIGDVNP